MSLFKLLVSSLWQITQYVYTMAETDRECQDNLKYDVQKINKRLKMNKITKIGTNLIIFHIIKSNIKVFSSFIENAFVVRISAVLPSFFNPLN